MPPIKRANRLYKKGKAYKDSRKFIVICEGIREANYFNFFHDKYKKLVVEVIAPKGEFHGHSAPSKLQERASNYIVEEGWDESLDDELWFIVDTDRWSEQLYELSQICNGTKNWFIANSNPCFEVWLIYHQDCSLISENSPREIKRILNAQKPSGYKLENYIVQIEKAINCSSLLDNHEDQNIADLGITKVYKLGRKILELIPRKDGDFLI